MADYTIRIESDSSKAERDIKRIEESARRLEQGFKVNIQFPSLQDTITGVEKLGRAIQVTYGIARNIPLVGDRLRDVEEILIKISNIATTVGKAISLATKATPVNILSTAFNAAADSAFTLSERLSRVGFVIFGLTQSVDILRAAYGKFFNETIGREVQLQQALLRTKTTLISTADVAVNGKRITDPFQAIIALGKPIEETIESIRTRSLDIAGTTSEAIVQTFGIVSSQIGQIGGNLKDAENLAISFAAALGTIGLSDPAYASQEIGSILRGDIDNNSILARSLSISNQDIAKAKKAGDLIGFITDKLKGFEAGQRIAAQGFDGIVSNIQEVQQELLRGFGKPLLDPILDGLTQIYERLQVMFTPAKGIADALGRTAASVGRGIAGGIAAAPSIENTSQRELINGLQNAEKAATKIFLNVQQAVDKMRPALAQIADEAIKAISVITAGLGELIEGLAAFRIEQFRILLTTFTSIARLLNSTVVPALNRILSIYGEILKQPAAQYLAQISAQFSILEKVGILPLVRLGVILPGLIASARVVLGWISTAAQAVGVAVGAAFSAIATGIAGLSAVASTVAQTISTVVSAAIQTILAQVSRLALVVASVLSTFAINLQLIYPEFGKVAVSIANVAQGFVRLSRDIDKVEVDVVQFANKTKAELDKLKVKAAEVSAAFKKIGADIQGATAQAGNAVGGFLGKQLLGIVGFLAKLAAWQIGITIVLDLLARFQRKQQELSDQTRAEMAIKRLNTVYKNLGESASAAAKAGRDFELSIVNNRIPQVTAKIEELTKKVQKLKELQDPDVLFRKGDILGTIEGSFTQLNDILNAPLTRGTNPQAERVKAVRDEITKAKNELDSLLREQANINENNALDQNVEVLAKDRKSLEKELGELRKQLNKEIQDIEFNERKNFLRTEQQIKAELRAQESAELERRLQREQQGLVGTRQAITQALSNYEKAVFDIQTQAQERQFELAQSRMDLEKNLEDYKYRLQEQTIKMQERIGKFNKDIADYESAEKIRAARIDLESAIKASKLRNGDFVLTPEDRDGFLNAASQRGVSATRLIALLNTGGAASIGASPGSDPKLIVDQLIKTFPAVGGMSEEQFRTAMASRAQMIGMSPSVTGDMIMANAQSEIKSGEFYTRNKKAPPSLNPITELEKQNASNIERYRAAVEKSFEAARRLSEVAATNAGKAAVDALIAALSDIALFTDLPEIKTLEDKLKDVRREINFLSAAALQGAPRVDELNNRLTALADNVYRSLEQGIDQANKRAVANGQAPLFNDAEVQQARALARNYAYTDPTSKSANDLITLIASKSPQLGEAFRALLKTAAEANQRERAAKPIVDQERNATAIVEILRKIVDLPAQLSQAVSDRTSQFLASVLPENDLTRRAALATESQLTSERSALAKTGVLDDPEVVKTFDIYAELTRKVSSGLAILDERISKFAERLALAREYSRDLVGGLKDALKSAITGGNITETLQSAFKGILDKVLGNVLDYAFKPLQDMIEGQLAKILGVDKPDDFIKANTTELSLNTAKLEAVRATLEKLIQLPSAVPPGIGGPDLPVGSASGPQIKGWRIGGQVGQDLAKPVPFSQQFDTPSPNKAPSSSILSIPVEPFKAVEENMKSLNNTIESTTTIVPAATKAVEEQVQAQAQLPEKINQTNTGLSNLLGGLTVTAAGIFGIVAGISQIGKGGSANLFGGIAAIAGSIAGVTASFAAPRIPGKALGGDLTANRPTFLGERGIELGIPNRSGAVVSTDQLMAASRAALRGSGRPSSGPLQEALAAQEAGTLSGSAAQYSEALTQARATLRDPFRTAPSVRRRILLEPGAPIDIRVDGRVREGVPTVTMEQFKKGMNETSEVTRSRLIRDIKNNPTLRTALGLTDR